MPLTAHTPKPMIPFHGKPFVEYLVEELRDAGVHRILMLLGYLPETIRSHFGSGSRWGVRMDYDVTDPDDETGVRLRHACDRLDSLFLLMYCDNYWPLQLDRMLDSFHRHPGILGQITVYANTDGYSRDNVRVAPDGMVEQFDKSRTAPNLRGVDIGYMLMRTEAVGSTPDGNVNFEREVFPRLVSAWKLAAYRTEHRYYSVGAPERLPATARFLERRNTIILDRDGVLNEKAPRADYVKNWGEFRWKPGAKQAMVELKRAGYRIILITNQAGIARGVMTEQDLADIHARLTRELEQMGGGLDAIYHCPHDWDAGCDCRKPKPGMFFRAQREHDLDLSRTYYIGDDERDEQAAHAAGCRFLMVRPGESLLDIVCGQVLAC